MTAARLRNRNGALDRHGRRARSVLHSWCVQADWNAPTVVGGEGALLRRRAGRRYLDMSSLAECMNLGHQHPAVVRAIQEQAERLCFVTAAWGAEPRARLAERLLEKSGLRGRARLLHARRRRRQRARGEVRAPGERQAARLGHRARPLVPRRELRCDGLLRRRADARAGRSGATSTSTHVPAALRLSLPLRLDLRRGVRASAQRAARRRRRSTRAAPTGSPPS